MINNSSFEDLLERYVTGHTTTEENEQLMQLIKSGAYDNILKQYIYDCLLNENTADNMDHNRAQELLNRILTSEQHTAQLITVAKSPKISWRSMASMAAVVFLIAVAIWWLLPRKMAPNTPIVKTGNPSQPLKPVIDSKGKKYIRLQDGSMVLLNEGSRLEYPEVFDKHAREVVLIGEGYFDISHDVTRPFVVHTGKVSTTVLGTAFNIKAYPGQKEITVTVTRGKVKVSDAKRTLGLVVPNESIAVNTENDTYRQEKVNAAQVVGWKEQYLVLDNLSLEEAALLINNKYHIDISFASENLKYCRISATFLNNESLEQVLTVVTGVVNAAYTIQPNDQVIISGSGCN